MRLGDSIEASKDRNSSSAALESEGSTTGSANSLDSSRSTLSSVLCRRSCWTELTWDDSLDAGNVDVFLRPEVKIEGLARYTSWTESVSCFLGEAWDLFEDESFRALSDDDDKSRFFDRFEWLSSEEGCSGSVSSSSCSAKLINTSVDVFVSS